MADQPSGQRHGRDHDVADRPSGGELGTDVVESGAELDEARAGGLGAETVELARAGAGGDQVAAVVLARPGDELRDGGGADPAAR